MSVFVKADHLLLVLEHLRKFFRHFHYGLIDKEYAKLPIPPIHLILPDYLRMHVRFQIDLLENVIHVNKDDICIVFKFLSFTAPITISDNFITIEHGSFAHRLASIEIPDLLIEIPQFNAFKVKEMESEVELRRLDAEQANNRAAVGRIMLATVGKLAPVPSTVRPIPLDHQPGFAIPKYFSKKRLFIILQIRRHYMQLR